MYILPTSLYDRTIERLDLIQQCILFTINYSKLKPAISNQPAWSKCTHNKTMKNCLLCIYDKWETVILDFIKL